MLCRGATAYQICRNCRIDENGVETDKSIGHLFTFKQTTQKDEDPFFICDTKRDQHHCAGRCTRTQKKTRRTLKSLKIIMIKRIFSGNTNRILTTYIHPCTGHIFQQGTQASYFSVRASKDYEWTRWSPPKRFKIDLAGADANNELVVKRSEL